MIGIELAPRLTLQSRNSNAHLVQPYIDHCICDHRLKNTRHPVRSAISKLQIARLVLRWVTTWESLVSQVKSFLSCSHDVFAKYILQSTIGLDNGSNCLSMITRNVRWYYTASETKIFSDFRSSNINSSKYNNIILVMNIYVYIYRSRSKSRKNLTWSWFVEINVIVADRMNNYYRKAMISASQNSAVGYCRRI